MLIGLTGYAGSGKNTVADILTREHGFKQYAFADKLRELVLSQNPLISYGFTQDLVPLTVPMQDLIEHVGWDRAKREYPGVRELLQNTGVWMRENVSEDFWVDLVDQAISDDDAKNVVITDVRFANENAYVHRQGGVVLKVLRPGIGPVNGHCSEALDFEPGGLLRNSGSLDELAGTVDEWVEYLRENEENMRRAYA